MSVISIDGSAKIIDLDDAAVESVPEIYSQFADQHKNNLQWSPAFETLALLPRVPVYATLINGWRIRMLSTGTPYMKTFENGFLSEIDGGDPFIPNGGIEPRVRFKDPALAVGYDLGSSTSDLTPITNQLTDIQQNQDVINQGVKKASKLIPHSQDVT
jgi:hypothetical protein